MLFLSRLPCAVPLSRASQVELVMPRPDYAELQITSNFRFLRRASHAYELITTAAGLGYRAVAITDRNTLAGIVRAHVAAKDAKLQFIVGAAH